MSSLAIPYRPASRRRLAAASRTLGRESALALAGIAVAAVHVADDSFIQPQPGTGPGDHLVSGLVPLALLAPAAFAYPRVRAGARVLIALYAGLFALVASVEAVYYAREQGASGDDYTGFLAIPAGLALLALGVVTLWRSRRRDDGLRRRYLRRALIAAAAVAAFFLTVVPIGFGYIQTHVGRGIAEGVDLGPRVEQVTFETADGLTLHGSYIPSRNGAAVIASPGYNEAPAHARMLARHGYGVLLFDQRGEGRSDGDPNAWGWSAEKDMVAALRFLQARPDVRDGRIGGLGLSVAGESLLQTAAHHRDLRAVVSEGAGSRSYKEEIDVPGTSLLGLPIVVAMTGTTAVFSGELAPAHLGDLMAQIEQPVFLIYSRNGVPSEKLNPAFDENAGGHVDALGDPRGRPHGGPADAARRVRAPRRGVLRRRAAGRVAGAARGPSRTRGAGLCASVARHVAQRVAQQRAEHGVRDGGVREGAPVAEERGPGAAALVGVDALEDQQRGPEDEVLGLGGEHALQRAAAADALEDGAEERAVGHVDREAGRASSRRRRASRAAPGSGRRRTACAARARAAG